MSTPNERAGVHMSNPTSGRRLDHCSLRCGYSRRRNAIKQLTVQSSTCRRWFLLFNQSINHCSKQTRLSICNSIESVPQLGLPRVLGTALSAW